MLLRAPVFDMKQTPNLIKGIELDDYHIAIGLDEMAAGVSRLEL